MSGLALRCAKAGPASLHAHSLCQDCSAGMGRDEYQTPTQVRDLKEVALHPPAAFQMCKGAQPMLSEESDLSHFSHSHGIGPHRWSQAHAWAFMLVCREKLFECTSQSSLSSWESGPAVGTEEVKCYSENTYIYITVKPYQWQASSANVQQILENM